LGCGNTRDDIPVAQFAQTAAKPRNLPENAPSEEPQGR